MPGYIDQYFLGYATIQTNGAPLPQRATLNFLGFTVQDDPVNNVTKVLGGSSGGTSGTLVGDVTTATTISGPTAATVVGIQGRTVASAVPADTYVLTWSAAQAYWYPASSSGNSGYLTSDVQTATIAGPTAAAVVSATGAGGSFPIASTGAQIKFAAGGATPGLYQTIAASSATPQSMTFAPQAPNSASSGATAGTPGSVVVSLSAPVDVGTWPKLVVESAGTVVAQLGPGGAGVNGYLWLGLNGAAPTVSNYAVGALGGTLGLQALSSYITMSSGGNGLMVLSPASSPPYVQGASFLQPSIGFIPTVVSPTIEHMQRNGDTATSNMTVLAQSAFAAATTNVSGGFLHLQGGAAKTNGATGLRGGARLQLGGDTAETMVEVTEVALGSRGVALASLGSGITSTNVPSGDGWVWVGKANVNPGVPTAGFVIYADASTGGAYCCNPGGSPFPLGAGGGTAASATGWYGGGEDGALVLNGTNTYPILQLVNPGSSATYAPYSDVYATTLVVNAGITLSSGPNGCQRILANVSVTNNGTIDCASGKPGQPGSGSSAGGNAIPAGTLGGSWAGASGGVGLAQGGGVAPTGTNVIVISLTTQLQGGGGGASAATSGGSGGGVSTIGTRPFAQPSVATGFACPGASPAYMVQFTGGSGGGGGGSDGTLDAGGGGGSSAGIGAILSPTITNNGVIRSLGGNGGAGYAGSSNAGGGGGGAGGVILITSNSGVIVGNAPVVTGGTGGAGAGSGGVSGQNGTNGKVIYSQP